MKYFLPYIVLCLLISGCTHSSMTSTPNAEWYAAGDSMDGFRHAVNSAQYREQLELDKNSPDKRVREWARRVEEGSTEIDAAAEVIRAMSEQEKCTFARVYVQEYAATLRDKLGMDAEDEDFIKDNLSRLHEENVGQSLSNWEGVLDRTLERLPDELRAKVDCPGMRGLMPGYGGYMVARYVQLNPEEDWHLRKAARGISALWYYLSDGEHGYRGIWLREEYGYHILNQ